jgi:hypothetical protein
MKMKLIFLSIVILIIGLLVFMEKDAVEAQYCVSGINPQTGQRVLWKGDCRSKYSFCDGGCGWL